MAGQAPFSLHDAAEHMHTAAVFVRLGEARNVAQQGGLAGTGSANKSHHFPFGHRQADIVQRATVAERSGEIFYVDHESLLTLQNDGHG